MTSFPWEDSLSKEELEVIARGKYGQTRGLGSRPVVLVIDCQHNYIGADAPITEQQNEWPAGGGSRAWAAVRVIEEFLPAARERNVPVIYTRNLQKKTIKFDMVSAKAGWDHSRTIEGDPGTEIVDAVAPLEDELVIDKAYASAFWGTPLLTYLVQLQADSIIVSGVSTSGCVRATAVDAITRGFRTAVVWDGVADRVQISHKASLLDLWMKYTDLMSGAEASAYLSDVAPQSA
ncbi:MAG: isochorismatase family protein [Gaiellaceae bacterium]